jgi:hypothetical protein
MRKPKRRTLDDFVTDGTEATTDDESIQMAVTKAVKTEKARQQLPTYIPNNAYEQLRKLAFDERASMNALILEGIDLVFKNRGLKSITELADS